MTITLDSSHLLEPRVVVYPAQAISDPAGSTLVVFRTAEQRRSDCASSPKALTADIFQDGPQPYEVPVPPEHIDHRLGMVPAVSGLQSATEEKLVKCIIFHSLFPFL